MWSERERESWVRSGYVGVCVRCITQTQTLGFLSLSYQKKDGRAGSCQSFFWYDTDYKILTHVTYLLQGPGFDSRTGKPPKIENLQGCFVHDTSHVTPASFITIQQPRQSSSQCKLALTTITAFYSQPIPSQLLYIVACQAHPALAKIGPVFVSFLWIRIPGEPVFSQLTDRVSSRLRGLAVYWRPRPSGTRQYVTCI